MDCLFLQISDETMANLGRDEIRYEHGVVEDALGAEDHHPHQPAWFVHLKESQQMHPLIIRFFEKSFDPALVEFEASD